MIFKLIILFFISYNFDTMYSFTDPTKLRQYYVNNAKQFNKVGSCICKFSKSKWAGACYEVLKKLREDDMYKYKLYVNYEPFNDYNKPSKCQLRKFFFLSSIERIDSPGFMQKMLPCFGRPALVKPDVSYKDYEYYDEFMIFPASEDSLYVYKRIPNSKNFYLLERFEEMKWANSMVINPELLTLPPPYIKNGNDPDFLRSLIGMDLLKMSLNPRNVINEVSTELFLLMRTTLMKALENENYHTYTVERINFRHIKRSSPSMSNLIFVHPDTCVKVTKKIQMYGCPTRSTSTPVKGIKESYNWKIAAATTTHSVFILNRTHNGYKIKVLIENLFSEYLSYII